MKKYFTLNNRSLKSYMFNTHIILKKMEKLDSSLAQHSDAIEEIAREKESNVNMDDSCPCRKEKSKVEEVEIRKFKLRSPGNDPRFQQQNQTQRCFVMYTDFYRCEHILGKNTEACTWFKEVFKAICPNAWVEQWDELRVTSRLPWHKYKTQGAFPGSKYGE